MELTNDQASFLLSVMLPQIHHEYKTTLKILKAVPADQGHYQPHPTCMNAMDLAWHTASAEIMFLEAALNGAFAPHAKPETVTNPAEVAAWYETHFEANYPKLSAMSGEQLNATIPFHHFQMKGVEYLELMMAHSVHHRGQMSVYLRPMGAKVPSIYGTSADDKASTTTA